MVGRGTQGGRQGYASARHQQDAADSDGGTENMSFLFQVLDGGTENASFPFQVLNRDVQCSYESCYKVVMIS